MSSEPAPEVLKDAPVIFFATPAEWEAWLAEHYESTQGVWLKFAKKDSGITSLSYDPALDIALCYGWIDGQARTYDQTYFLRKFTPRRARSMWSKRNIGIVAQLIKAGRMQPSGQAAIDAAKTDGRWGLAYDSPANMTMPADFQTALASHPKAQAFYETLNRTNTYAFLYRIQTAKQAQTRAKRIEQFIQMLEAGKTLY